MPVSPGTVRLASRLRRGVPRALVVIVYLVAMAGGLPTEAQGPVGILTIEKSGPTGLVQMGSRLSYTVTVGNAGSAPLTSVVVQDHMIGLAAGVALLAPGERAQFGGVHQVTDADVPADLEAGATRFSLRNTAHADSDQTDPVSASWTVDVEYWFNASRAVVGLQMACPATAQVGKSFVVGLAVQNIGDVPLANVRVASDALGLDENVGSLAVGAAGQLSATHRSVGQEDLPGPLVLEAAAWSDRAERATARCEVSVLAAEVPSSACVRADLSVVMQGAGPGSVVHAWVGGTEQEARVTAPNAGGEPQVTWTFYPPEGVSWTVRVSADLPAGFDANRWEVTSAEPTTVSVRRCDQRVITLRVVDREASAVAGGEAGGAEAVLPILPQPGGVQPAVMLPQTGAWDEGPSVERWCLGMLVAFAGLLSARAFTPRKV